MVFKFCVSVEKTRWQILSNKWTFVISGFRRDVDDIWALLGCYATSSGNPLPTYPSHLQGSRSPRRLMDTWRWDRYVFPETSVKDYHSTLRNIPEERRSQINICSEWRTDLQAGWHGIANKLFFKGPAADATDAPQNWGLLFNPVKMISSFSFSL
jgi:hypothetical protein